MAIAAMKTKVVPSIMNLTRLYRRRQNCKFDFPFSLYDRKDSGTGSVKTCATLDKFHPPFTGPFTGAYSTDLDNTSFGAICFRNGHISLGESLFAIVLTIFSFCAVVGLHDLNSLYVQQSLVIGLFKAA